MPISIDGNGTITGAATLATVVTNATLTTPTFNSAQFATVSGTAPIYGCRAWVNFNGTGTVAIRASGNVSSITDNGTGDYTVNFTTAMPDANYSVAGMGCRSSGGLHASLMFTPDVTPTASAVRVINLAGTDGRHDPLYCSVQISR